MIKDSRHNNKKHFLKLFFSYFWNFSLLHRVQTGSGDLPASYPRGNGALPLGIKRPVREADHSLPSSAEVKNAWH